MTKTLNIALVAHDARKQELIEWCKHNLQLLSKHNLFATGTTGKLIEEINAQWVPIGDTYYMEKQGPLIDKVTKLLSGPLGGDQQIGAMIAQGEIDVLIFFCDNLITQGHQQDVGALVRLASLYNIAFATNRTTADMIITSSLIENEEYKPIMPTAIENYKNRFNI
jgi:methylglyoxal synthase